MLASIHSNTPNVSPRGELKNPMPVALRCRALGEWMGAASLKILERDGGKGFRYPMQLFERSDADTVVAFSSGRATWRERLFVSSALPRPPFSTLAPSTLIGQAPKFLGACR